MKKQQTLNKIAEKNGKEPKTATIELKDCIDIMSEDELHTVMLTYLPLVNIDENPTKERCMFMVGTLKENLLLKANKIMVRVGGGYMTLQEHIRQVGPFECIKIYKHMKSEEAKSTETIDKIKLFRQAVIHFLNKHKTSKRMIDLYK